MGKQRIHKTDAQAMQMLRDGSDDVPSPLCDTPCWVWRGRTDANGYARFCHRRMKRGSQVAWALYHGQQPQGLVVRHRCDVKACVNPDHLELGTQVENAEDARRRGRVLTTGGTADKSPCLRPITQRQVEVISFMVVRDAIDGWPPTVRSICSALGLASPNAVQLHLNALERKGYIIRDGRVRFTDKARALMAAIISPEAA